jgi:hypothetical protein
LPSGPAHDLVIGQRLPRDIVVDPSNVYWICEPEGGGGGAIWTVPKRPDAGAAAVFADAGEVSANQAVSLALAGDTEALYWTDGPAAWKKAKAGGPPLGLIWLGGSDTDGICQGLTVVPGRMYVTTTGHGGEVAVTETASPSQFYVAQSLAKDVTVLTVDATDVYVGRPTQILKVPKGGSDGGAPVVFATTDGPVQAIVNDDTSVYWADTSRVRSLDKLKVGETPIDLATAQNSPWAIAVDDDGYVYWTNAGDGVVRAIAKTGGEPKTLSTGEGQPMAIAVDATGVFWTNYSDGRVRVIWR